MPVVGVVGAGVVGGRIVRMLASSAHVVVYDRRRDAARPLADGAGAELLGSLDALERCNTVVLAHPLPHTELALRLVRSGINVVSVMGDCGEVGQLIDMDEHARANGASLTVGAAMSPGLSGLIARWLSKSVASVDEIHVAIHGTAGPACAYEHHGALSSRARGWHDGDWIERPGGSGRELCWFPEPVGAYDCYRADLADPLLVHRTFPSAVRISARMSANRRDRLTAWLPMLRPPHPEGGVGALRVELRDADEYGARVTVVGGVAELVGTAAAATAAAFAECAASGVLAPGVVIPGDAGLPTVELLERVTELGVRVQSFTGVPTPR